MSAAIEPSPPSPTPPLSHPGQRQMLLAVIIAGFCTFLQMYITQPLLPYFRHLFGASAIKVSLTVSAVTTAVALASPFIGLLADAVGRKRIIVPSILGLGLCTLLAATSVSLTQLVFWRFAQGLFVPGIIAVTLAYIAEESAVGTTGAMTAAYVTGTVLGGLCGRFLTALLAEHLTWQWAFALLGLTTMLCGAVTWWLLPRSRRFTRHPQPRALLAAMASHLRNPRLLATYFVGFNVLFSLVGIFTYANFYLAGPPFHLGLVGLGSVFWVYALGVVVTPASGLWIDRVGYRTALVWATAIVAVGALLTLVPSLPLVVLGLGVLSTGVFVCQSAASSHTPAVALGARSAATGLYVAFYYLGGSVGATALGLLWNSGGWPSCIACILLIQILTALAAYLFFQKRKPSISPAVALDATEGA